MSKRIVMLTIAFLLLSCGQWVHAQEGGPVEPAVMIGLSPGQPPVYGGAGFAPGAADEAPPLGSAAVASQPSGVPGPAMVDPVTLLITKLWDAGIPGWRLNLAWSGSAGPFSLLTSPYIRFQTSVTTLADSTTDTSQSFAANTGRTLECFEVSDGTTVTVAGQNLGYDPRPNPTAATYTNKGYWWGENITVSASYLDAIGPENLAHFYDRPAKGTSPVADASHPGYASQVTFTIPADTHSTYLRLEAAGKMSPYTGWLQMVAPGVTFGSVTGIVWAPQDGKVYVTDSVSNNISMVDLFKVVPTASSLALGMTVTNPRISRVSDADEFVYISGAAGAPEVRVWTAGGGDAHYANTTDAGFTSSITPLGIALHPNGSACYIADATSRQVIRIPRGNATAINGRWGNVTFGSFSNPCGIDAEPSGAVDIGSGYYTYRINPAGNGYANNGSTGSILPKHLEVDRDMNYTSGTGFTAYASEPFCDAYNRNPIEAVAGSDGSTTARYTGAIVWSTDDTQHLLLDQIYRYNLYPHYPQAVILNNSGKSTSEAAYPSTNQTQDRIIKITASGLPTRALQLRLIDPPDFAPYAPVGGWCGTLGYPACTAVPPYEGKDNLVGDTYGLTTDPNGVSPAPAMEMRLDILSGQWTRDFYLKVPARYSGNNFRVEARKINPNTNLPVAEKIVALSGLYTTWKRVFIERDRMFRRGNLLDSEVVAPPAGQLYLARWDSTTPATDAASYVQASDQIVVFDSDHAYPSGSYEAVAILSSPAPAFFDAAKPGGGTKSVLRVSLDRSLANTYTASPIDFSSGKSAAVGVISGCDPAGNQINASNSCFYDADMRDTQQPYSDAFTEIIGSLSGVGAIPFISNAIDPFYVSASGEGNIEPGKSMRNNYQRLWFNNKDTLNYIHSLGVRGDELVLGDGVGGFSWVWHLYLFTHIETLGKLETDPLLLSNLWRTTHSHECGHLFKTNWCAQNNHDARSAWCALDAGSCGSEPCLMNPDGGNGRNDVNRFCPEDLILGDPDCGAFYDGSVRGCADLVYAP